MADHSGHTSSMALSQFDDQSPRVGQCPSSCARGAIFLGLRRNSHALRAWSSCTLLLPIGMLRDHSSFPSAKGSLVLPLDEGIFRPSIWMDPQSFPSAEFFVLLTGDKIIHHFGGIVHPSSFRISFFPLKGSLVLPFGGVFHISLRQKHLSSFSSLPSAKESFVLPFRAIFHFSLRRKDYSSFPLEGLVILYH
ncbi:uncharacterized protein G2W53_022481 [Senna tora]|uniref:Uncharacterized protein n=1 Tax=Senna tora TaxID=362788 RepID=A0A834TMC9_9FABA|nr:uncharacterized protein G2W53_022481 [Senna tora]